MINKTKIAKAIPFILCVIVSIAAAIVFYKPFFFFAENFLGPNINTGFDGINIPPYEKTEPIIAIFDFSFVFFLALFLSFFFDWKETLRHWAYGYLLLIGLSIIFLAAVYFPDPLRFLFILISASAGFLIGQGLRHLGIRIKL